MNCSVIHVNYIAFLFYIIMTRINYGNDIVDYTYLKAQFLKLLFSKRKIYTLFSLTTYFIIENILLVQLYQLINIAMQLKHSVVLLGCYSRLFWFYRNFDQYSHWTFCSSGAIRASLESRVFINSFVTLDSMSTIKLVLSDWSPYHCYATIVHKSKQLLQLD